MTVYLSVVIPVYNERDNFLSGRLDVSLKFLQKQKYRWEIVFVNDGSTDDSRKLLNKLAKTDKRFRVVSIPHGGKMKAVFAGAKEAKGEIILFADFDQSTPMHFLKNFIAHHKKGADIVIGARGKGEDRIKSDSILRKIRSQAFLILASLIVMRGIDDFFCGFKTFTREAANSVFNNLKATDLKKMHGAYMGAWDVEALFIARKMGYKIAQEPVDWYKVKSMKLHVIKEPMLILMELIKIRVINLKGGYANLK